mmetsp:Transcript_13181/g.52600  ORF Transcript_13181/g.52600 Transcript_13181/m.52600 type:complete len:259 (+) Transcript_13181:265-1041(+)
MRGAGGLAQLTRAAVDAGDPLAHGVLLRGDEVDHAAGGALDVELPAAGVALARPVAEDERGRALGGEVDAALDLLRHVLGALVVVDRVATHVADEEPLVPELLSGPLLEEEAHAHGQRVLFQRLGLELLPLRRSSRVCVCALRHLLRRPSRGGSALLAPRPAPSRPRRAAALLHKVGEHQLRAHPPVCRRVRERRAGGGDLRRRRAKPRAQLLYGARHHLLAVATHGPGHLAHHPRQRHVQPLPHGRQLCLGLLGQAV